MDKIFILFIAFMIAVVLTILMNLYMNYYKNIDVIRLSDDSLNKRKDDKLREDLKKYRDELKLKEKRLETLKKNAPFHETIIHKILDILLENNTGMSIQKILILLSVISGTSAMIGLLFQGVLQSILLALVSLMLLIMVINLMGEFNNSKKNNDIYEFMLLNQGNYMTLARIEDAFQRTADTLPKNNFMIKPLAQYRARIVDLNDSRENSLNYLKEYVGTNDYFSKMVDIILKAEGSSKEYKKALIGITTAYKLKVKTLQYEVMALGITTGIMNLLGILMLAITITTGIDSELQELMRISALATVLFTTAYIMFTMTTGFILVFSVKKKRRDW